MNILVSGLFQVSFENDPQTSLYVWGDLIAIEAKYHFKCLICLKNQYRTLCAKKTQESSHGDGWWKNNESMALVELVELVECIERCVDNRTHNEEINRQLKNVELILESKGI